MCERETAAVDDGDLMAARCAIKLTPFLWKLRETSIISYTQHWTKYTACQKKVTTWMRGHCSWSRLDSVTLWGQRMRLVTTWIYCTTRLFHQGICLFPDGTGIFKDVNGWTHWAEIVKEWFTNHQSPEPVRCAEEGSAQCSDSLIINTRYWWRWMWQWMEISYSWWHHKV